MMVSTVRRWPCASSAAGAQASGASRSTRVLLTSLLPCPEHVERRVVHEPVGADARAGVDRALTTQTCGAPSPLLDDPLEGGDVPWVHDPVNRDLTGAFGDQHVLVEVTQPPGAVHALRQPHDPGWRPAPPAGPEITMEQHRLLEISDLRHAEAARSRERPRSAGGVPAGAERGRARDAGHDLSLRLDGEQSPEDRDAAHKADRAVDGIDDQPGACRPGIIPLLFPENAQAGMTLARERAGHRLDGLVHIGDWAVVGLLLDLEAGRPEAAQRELVGPVGDLVEQREPALGAHAGAALPRPPAPAPCRAPAARATPPAAAGRPVRGVRSPRHARRGARRA